ncbi:MAG: DUF3604 domain-containing protein, partial [Planctomycetota bacterium]
SPAASAQVSTDGGTITQERIGRVIKKRGYSPFAGRPYPTRPLWGDQHTHTSWSGDAGAVGTTLGPADVLRLARGEEVTSNTGQAVRLSRPYDWLVVTDHAEALGIIKGVIAGDPALMVDPTIREWNKGINAGGEAASRVLFDIIERQSNGRLPEVMLDPESAFDMWKEMTEIVESYDDPGEFTALIGYEWTSNAGGGNNLHRNVIYRGGKQVADLVAPFTSLQSEDPEDLWAWMRGYEETTGSKVLAIPHNGNLSNGRMFALETFDGEPLDEEWVRERARWEPVYEISQSKGTSEQHPLLATDDGFADFEIWDQGNLNLVPKQPEMLAYEYFREAVKNGLRLEAEFGVNPFKLGVVAGTDTHTGMSTPEENNFFGKFAGAEPSAERWNGIAFKFGDREIRDWEIGASGLTAVWAAENTRASIWDAMKRREVYGTTGSRITVRFFGGYDFTAEDALARDVAARGYSKGVPMGGDLGVSTTGEAPSFLVGAMKDPLSGNLDRIQIIKGWVDAEGETHERVFDVAWSGDRVADADGKVPSVGSTVDLETASFTNTIGAAELLTVWTDPEFDPTEPSFYYARVIEIPTPRWTAYDAVYFGVDMAPEVRMTVTERAYTSPIWHSPMR